MVDSLLAAGDTGSAIAALREDARTAADQCLLATLIGAQATSRRADWRRRLEAQQSFERSVRARPDPGCLLAYSALKEKQGIRVDASRLAKRALALLREHPELASPETLAEAYYRRALPLADWVRNFEHLVAIRDLPVSTPTCTRTDGYFCESLEHPFLFFERLARGTRLDGLVLEERGALETLLDSALAQAPGHVRALGEALRQAAVAEDWPRFRDLAIRARDAAPRAVGPVLALLTADVMEARFDRASALFDTLTQRMGGEAMARYEGLALIADPESRERLEGPSPISHVEAIWGLSDPLYLTAANERRLAHYARVSLADLLFGDPPQGVSGRDTDQGRLLIRYGFPRYWFTVTADKVLELTPAQQELSDDLLACATTPVPRGVPPDCSGVAGVPSKGQAAHGGGRWSFWFYDSTAPPFIFERGLGMRIARHKVMTESRALDDALLREAPSTYESPFREAGLRALITRFPRPHRSVVEVHGRFEWDSTALTADSVRFGYFVHDRTTGQLVRLGRSARLEKEPGAAFSADIEIPWGKFRVAVEGLALGAQAAAQLLAGVDLVQPAAGTLALSDLLLGDSAQAPDVIGARHEVWFHARPDSLYSRNAPLALYWEAHGLGTETLRDTLSLPDARLVHYRVRLSLQDAGGRPVAARVLRSLGSALGLRQTQDQVLEWEVRRVLPGPVAPDLVLLTTPDDTGDYRIIIEITDLVGGDVAVAQRVISLQDLK